MELNIEVNLRKKWDKGRRTAFGIYRELLKAKAAIGLMDRLDLLPDSCLNEAVIRFDELCCLKAKEVGLNPDDFDNSDQIIQAIEKAAE